MLFKFQSTRPHGARRDSNSRRNSHGNFNPRALTGRDTYSLAVGLRYRTFQSTRPHGARRTCCKNPCVLAYFNPRALTGRDVIFLLFCQQVAYFNPRALTGRDGIKRFCPSLVSEFQSTRPHGARPFVSFPTIFLQIISIHAPSRGATRLVRDEIEEGIISIHAPSRGATRVLRPCLQANPYFNPRALTGRD